jgi:far upstream element-binding protein
LLLLFFFIYLTANPADAVSDALAAALSSSAKRPTLNSHYESSQKIYIPVDQNPGYNYIGLLIGPGGAKQRELVSQSGGNVKISIRGKGSSSSNAVPGQPEEPLHVALEGSVDSVAKAQALVNELLNDSTKAQAEKEKQLAVVAGSKGDSHGQGFGGSSTYQPKPVAQLLGLNANHYGPAPDATEVVEEKIGVPNGVVGFIIGKGGESITSMQRKSGCRVQIQKEHEMESGTTQRIITLIGATQESVSMCRGIIEEMVKERLRLNDEQGGGRFSGPGNNAAGQAAQLQTALSEGHQHVQVRAPNNDVGLIIGKGGMTIRSIQERSGANVQIPQAADGDNPMVRTINITHPSKEGAEFAKTLIEEVLNSKTNHSGGTSSYSGGNAGNNPSDVSVQIQVSLGSFSCGPFLFCFWKRYNHQFLGWLGGGLVQYHGHKSDNGEAREGW